MNPNRCYIKKKLTVSMPLHSKAIFCSSKETYIIRENIDLHCKGHKLSLLLPSLLYRLPELFWSHSLYLSKITKCPIFQMFS